MNEQRTWLDHPVYQVYRNRARYWEAAILMPTSQTPIILRGEKTREATVNQVKGTYGKNAERLSEEKFLLEIQRRRVHTPEMLDLLKDNWMGQDLRGWHVYGSILRPMTGIRIDGTVFLNGNGARYDQYEIYTYVVAKDPLDASTIEHYTLVTVSHP